MCRNPVGYQIGEAFLFCLIPAISHACPPFLAVASWVAMRTYVTIFCLLLTLGPSWAAEPTLARLSFWVPPERQAIPADQAQVHRQTAPGILRTSQNTPFYLSYPPR